MNYRLKLPNINKLNELFRYSRGRLFWRKNNKEAGTLTDTGYIRVGINRKQYHASRIVYKLFYNKEPFIIDHINGNPKDNRIGNLQKCNRQLNKLKGKSQPNKAGYKYVTMKGLKYQGQYTINKKTYYVGLFESAKKAHNEVLNVIK